MLVVDDPERVGVQVTAKLSDNDVRKPPDHFQVARAVVVLERGRLVLVSFVGSRAHVADQVHLKFRIVDFVEGTKKTCRPVNFYWECSSMVQTSGDYISKHYRIPPIVFQIHNRVKLEMRSQNRIILSRFSLFYPHCQSRFAISLSRIRQLSCRCRWYFTATSGCGDIWIFAENAIALKGDEKSSTIFDEHWKGLFK